jgi:cytochrome subunit of sulfide dehydrogenase
MVRPITGDLMVRTLAMLGALCLAPAAFGQDSAARNLAAACAICHGTDGHAVTKEVIPLAGLPREHIAAQMRAFRDGQRPATVMHQIAKGYTDAQIDALAAWFSSQKR